MYFYGKGLKRNVAALLDNGFSDVDKISLAITVNSFLTVPVSYDEALEIYAELLKMCSENDGLISEPLRSRFLTELRNVAPVVITRKMRSFSLPIRRILVDSIASSIRRHHDYHLGYMRDEVGSDSAANTLAIADDVALIVSEISE